MDKTKTYFQNRDGRELDYSRWQQSLIGVLMIDIEYDEEVERPDLASPDLTIKHRWSDLHAPS